MKLIFNSFILTLILLTSCSQKVKEFKINSDLEHVTLILYSDSTFTEEIKELEDTYTYAGNWTGNHSEGSTFTTTTTSKGLTILTQTPKKTYKVKNNRAIQITPN